MHTRQSLVTLLALMSAVAPLRAQAIPDLEQGVFIRVTHRTAHGSMQSSGTYAGVSADTLLVHTDRATLRILVRDIDTLELGDQERLMSPVAGAALGVLGGWAIGTLAGAIYYGIACDGDRPAQDGAKATPPLRPPP